MVLQREPLGEPWRSRLVGILADCGKSSVSLDNENSDGFAGLISRSLVCRWLPLGADRDGAPPLPWSICTWLKYQNAGSQGVFPQMLHLELNVHLQHSDPLIEPFIPAGRCYFSQRHDLLTNLGMEICFLSLNRTNSVLQIIVIINNHNCDWCLWNLLSAFFLNMHCLTEPLWLFCEGGRAGLGLNATIARVPGCLSQLRVQLFSFF